MNTDHITDESGICFILANQHPVAPIQALAQ
jgi:hypothetical protein